MTDERLENAGSQATGAATATVPPVLEVEEKAVAAPKTKKTAKAVEVEKRGPGRPKGSKNQAKRVGRPKGRKVVQVSLADLEKQLAERQAMLAQAETTKRAEVMAQLQAVDAALSAIGAVNAPVVKRGRKPGSKVAKVAKNGGRRAPGTTLPDFIEKVLKRRTNGMDVSTLVEAVTKAGYQTNSANLKPMIAAALRDTRFRRVSRGVYAMK